jgi:hypothetical protein
VTRRAFTPFESRFRTPGAWRAAGVAVGLAVVLVAVSAVATARRVSTQAMGTSGDSGSTGADVLAYGDAPNVGSLAEKPLEAPIVAMSPSPSGKGSWLVASDGGIFSFGDPAFHSSAAGTTLQQPVAGIVRALAVFLS